MAGSARFDSNGKPQPNGEARLGSRPLHQGSVRAATSDCDCIEHDNFVRIKKQHAGRLALAVLLLIASSNLVGCETGYCKLDAMAPFKSERSWERDPLACFKGGNSARLAIPPCSRRKEQFCNYSPLSS
jgi:hypothetical protein